MRGRRKAVVVACAAAVAGITAAPAQAEWLKATSRHFQIYSDTTPEQIRTLATRLEQVDGALRLISGAKDTTESAANPVTVYVLDDEADVGRLVGSSAVAGVYYGRASGAVAFKSRRAGYGLGPQLVLFHEYAHHYLLAQSIIAYPAWLSEGYAEFVSTARFRGDSIQIGAPAQHRAYALLGDTKLPIETLFAPAAKLEWFRTDQIYGRGWLLTHYIIFGDKTRRAQLPAYLDALAAGVPPLQVAQKAFGDLRQLNRELDRYMGGRFTVADIETRRLPTVAIDVRPLSPGARALIEQRIVSTRGVNAKTAAAVFARGARAAAPFPDDPVAQGWLTEMALDAGDLAAAEAAADRALAADPKSSQALMYKGLARLRRAAQAKLPATDKAWAEARGWIVKANRLDTDSAAPLSIYYDSFAMAGAAPNKSAIAGLHRAQELAPHDDDLRFRSARQLLIDGEVDDAKRTLRPLAFSPHAGPENPAARLLAMLDKGSTGPAAIATLDADAEQAAKKPKAD